MSTRRSHDQAADVFTDFQTSFEKTNINKMLRRHRVGFYLPQLVCTSGQLLISQDAFKVKDLFQKLSCF